MPLEIKELHIKATVNQSQSGVSQKLSGSKKADDDSESLINQCVEEVIRIINDKKER